MRWLTIAMFRGSGTIVPLSADALVYSTDRTASTESITITAIGRSAFAARHWHKNVIVGIWEKENKKHPGKIRTKKIKLFLFSLGDKFVISEFKQRHFLSDARQQEADFLQSLSMILTTFLGKSKKEKKNKTKQKKNKNTWEYKIGSVRSNCKGKLLTSLTCVVQNVFAYKTPYWLPNKQGKSWSLHQNCNVNH